MNAAFAFAGCLSIGLACGVLAMPSFAESRVRQLGETLRHQIANQRSGMVAFAEPHLACATQRELKDLAAWRHLSMSADVVSEGFAVAVLACAAETGPAEAQRMRRVLFAPESVSFDEIPVAVLLTCVCNCESTWVSERHELTVGRCGACGNFPVFPSADEEMGEPHKASDDLPDDVQAEGFDAG